MAPTNEAAPRSAAQEVRRRCAEAFGVPEVRMLGRSRVRPVAHARQVACYVLRHRFPELSFTTIARLMGGRDHSTIIHAVTEVGYRIARNPDLTAIVADLIAEPLAISGFELHVLAWRMHLAARDATPAPPPPPEPVFLGDDLAEFIEVERLWCRQCDRAVRPLAAARCEARLCALRCVELESLAA